MRDIRIAVLGVGNCASSLVQGLTYYADSQATDGLINQKIGSYGIGDIAVVLGIDVDARKVGLDVSEAIFSAPNNTLVFQQDVPATGAKVMMGRVMDGVAAHMCTGDDRGFQISDAPEPSKEDVVKALRESGATVLVNYLPVGSQEAAEFYMECALEAHVAVVNCIPVFIASDPQWAERFRARNLPIVGDDIKAQVGATIIHRALSELFAARGATISRTYQLNTGGNTDFMNMLDRSRLQQKKESKTESVQAALAKRLEDNDILIGPAEYVPWQKDNKVCFLRIEGENWGGAPVNVELRLAVEDSPNSAACVVDAIRCAQIALDRGEGGPVLAASACYCKHPPQQFDDSSANRMLAAYLEKHVTAAA